MACLCRYTRSDIRLDVATDGSRYRADVGVNHSLVPRQPASRLSYAGFELNLNN